MEKVITLCFKRRRNEITVPQLRQALIETVGAMTDDEIENLAIDVEGMQFDLDQEA